MLGLEGYGSDESDTESTPQNDRPQPLPSSSKKSASLLPLLSNVTTTLPSKTKPKRPVFTVARPSKASSDDEDVENERVAKKSKVEPTKGAGSSSLLAILPAPSKAATAVAPTRVLGSAAKGGSGTGVKISFLDDVSTGTEASIDLGARKPDEGAKSTSLLPPTLAKAKPKLQFTPTDSTSASPAVDFFSLGAAASRSAADSSASTINNNIGESSLISVSSAPTVPTYEPPTPTPSDPYPGYYQLPSGQWAAYDPDFYKKYYESWYLDGNTQKGFEGAEGENTLEIDAQQQLDRARKEREDKKALTANVGRGSAAPNMNIKRPKIGSLARTRHQLSALLTEAYENREALEEKIAQGRRNRKEAGNKYGF